MAFFSFDELIDRARVWVDDDHTDNSGWIKRDKWEQFATTAINRRTKQWIRMGLISPTPVDLVFTASSVVVGGVIAIIGVAENLGSGRYRVLQPLQSQFGRAPIMSTINTSQALFWRSHDELLGAYDGGAASSNLRIFVEPAISSSYFVRYISTGEGPAAAQGAHLPFNADELIVLDMAKAAGIKDGTRSGALADALREAEAELNFTAFGMANGNSPRIRSTPRTYSAALDFPTNPLLYTYR